MQLLQITPDVAPEIVDLTKTKASVTKICNGLYEIQKVVGHEIPDDLRATFLSHLELLASQDVTEEEQLRRLDHYLKRQTLEERNEFSYCEHLDFSILQHIAEKREAFPSGWNMNNLPGRLTELYKVNTHLFPIVYSLFMCYYFRIPNQSMV